MGFPKESRAKISRPERLFKLSDLVRVLYEPCVVSGLRIEDGFHVITLADGSEVPDSAAGDCRDPAARYRRLSVPNLEHYRGAGVYYAATDLKHAFALIFPFSLLVRELSGPGGIYSAQTRMPSFDRDPRRFRSRATMSPLSIEQMTPDPNMTCLRHRKFAT